MDKTVLQKIEYELSQIDELLGKVSLLLNLVQVKDPDFIELCAIGSILHSYYNGIENIMMLIVKNIDEQELSGDKWHKQLLYMMFEKTEKRNKVFEERLKPQLIEYQGFRHFFRHAYGHSIQWNKMKTLFLNIEENWNMVKKNLHEFVSGQ